MSVTAPPRVGDLTKEQLLEPPPELGTDPVDREG